MEYFAIDVYAHKGRSPRQKQPAFVRSIVLANLVLMHTAVLLKGIIPGWSNSGGVR